jgi:hypothetical protein
MQFIGGTSFGQTATTSPRSGVHENISASTDLLNWAAHTCSGLKGREESEEVSVVLRVLAVCSFTSQSPALTLQRGEASAS